MDKYDYITATIDEEKLRLEKIISYLEENNLLEELTEYKERYNNICKYLNAKERYLHILSSIKDDKNKLEDLNKRKDEYEVDNILLEDTLISRFNEDTGNIYKNILYENIKNEDIKDILYLIVTKESNYTELVIKRNRLKERLDKSKYPKTYDTLISQDVLIEEQDNTLDEIFIIENNIKIEEEKLKAIEDSILTDSILKILYEFWIIDTYDLNKVNRDKLFIDNRNFINIKNDISTEETLQEKNMILNLNLPGVNENNLIDIDGKKYVND